MLPATAKKRKRVKKILQSTQPTEYMGQDFTKLGDLLDELQDLGMEKSMKKKDAKDHSKNQISLLFFVLRLQAGAAPSLDQYL